MPLVVTPNFHRATSPHPRAFTAGDEFYEALIETHRGLSEAESHALNARLILLLANHIGDLGVLREALAKARGAVAGGVPPEVSED